MSRAVPTIRAVPDDVDPARRELDRRFPAGKTTVRDDSGRSTYFVHAGRTEVVAHDAADQARIIFIHNLLGGHRTKDECMEALRIERQS